MKTPKEFIKSSDIQNMEGQAKVHLLNSKAVRNTKSLGALTGLTDLGFQIMTVEPDHEYSEYHRHIYEEQCFYILSGNGEVIIDEKSYSITVGDFLGFPMDVLANTIFNNCFEPLCLICARLILEKFFCDYPRKKKRLYMNGAEESLVDFSNIRKDD
jgi:uncharacterized cupin superfamily protein